MSFVTKFAILLGALILFVLLSAWTLYRSLDDRLREVYLQSGRELAKQFEEFYQVEVDRLLPGLKSAAKRAGESDNPGAVLKTWLTENGEGFSYSLLIEPSGETQALMSTPGPDLNGLTPALLGWGSTALAPAQDEDLFFIRPAETTFQVYSLPVYSGEAGSGDPGRPGRRWFLIREWDSVLKNRWNAPSIFTVLEVVRVRELEIPPELLSYGGGSGVIRYYLPGPGDITEAAVDLRYDLPPKANVELQYQRPVWILMGVIAMSICALSVFLFFVYVRPLSRISLALKEKTPDPIGRMTGSRNEFGEIARLLARELRKAQMLETELSRLQNSGQETVPQESVFPRFHPAAVSRALHDNVIQGVYAVGLRIASLQQKPDSLEDPLRRDTVLGELIRDLNRVVADIRNIIMEMEPEVLKDVDLEDGLFRLEQDLSPIAPEAFSIDYRLPSKITLQRSVEIDLFLIVKELMSNAIRHADPTKLNCDLWIEGEMLRLRSTNDGVRSEKKRGSGKGHENIRTKMREWSGRMDIQLRPPNFLIDISVPIYRILTDGSNQTGSGG